MFYYHFLRKTLDIDQATSELIWRPVIEFENLLQFEKKKLYGRKSTFSFGFYYSTLMYLESIHLTFSCPFVFDNFPFDSHECSLQYGSCHSDDKKKVVLGPSKIASGISKTELGDAPIILNGSSLPFELELRSMPAIEKIFFTRSYSFTGMNITLKRTRWV